MRLVRMVLVLAFTAPIAVAIPGARAGEIDRIEVTEYGLYSADVAKAENPTAQGISRKKPVHIRLQAATRNVPLRKGIEFGFRYRLVGPSSSAAVPLRVVVLFPAPGLHVPGKPDPVLRTEYSKTVKPGKSQFLDYSIDDDWELVPGDWTFEIWQGDRKLTAQTFTVR